MSKENVRAHVIVPKELIEAVDDLVGKRGRSRFFAEAAEEKLARRRLEETARKAAGSLAAVDIPGWETSESSAEWVRASRTADEARMRHWAEDL